MIKAVAAVMLISGFSLAGHCFAAFQAKRVSVLEDIMLMLSVIETRLGYDCPPVTDIMKILSENPALSRLEFLKSCFERVCAGEPFPSAWRESVNNQQELCRLLAGSTEQLCVLGEELGATDLEAQLRKCEYYKKVFSAELELQKEKSQKYSKLFPPLGFMLGICAAIIII